MTHLAGDFENLDAIVLSERHGEVPTFPAANTLSIEHLAAVQKHGSEMIKWVEGVLEYNQQRGEAGHLLPGYKMVLSRGGNRAWSDAQKAQELLLSTTILKKSEIITEKLIGPAGVEKLLGKNKLPVDLTNLIVKPPGSPVLAPVEDKREAIGNSAVSEFTNLDNPSEPAE